ncbi:MAG: hypothetical protein ABH879_03330 [archaeon]
MRKPTGMLTKKRKTRKQNARREVRPAVGFTALVILMAVALFITLTGELRRTSALQEEREVIMRTLENGSASNIGFVVDGNIDDDRLRKVIGHEYEELKREMGIDHDFCVYFEDAEGNLIDLGEEFNYISCLGCPEDKVAGHCR